MERSCSPPSFQSPSPHRIHCGRCSRYICGNCVCIRLIFYPLHTLLVFLCPCCLCAPVSDHRLILRSSVLCYVACLPLHPYFLHKSLYLHRRSRTPLHLMHSSPQKEDMTYKLPRNYPRSDQGLIAVQFVMGRSAYPFVFRCARPQANYRAPHVVQ